MHVGLVDLKLKQKIILENEVSKSQTKSRIEELYEEAENYADSVCDINGVYEGKEYLQVVREKFADLIIEDCVNICTDNEDYLSAKIIKVTFGKSF